MYGDSNVSISNGSRGEFNGKFTAKDWFSDRVFYITIADADIGSPKSLHTLFDKYLDHMLVRFEQNFELFDKKMLNHFWQSVNIILEDVYVTKIIFWC